MRTKYDAYLKRRAFKNFDVIGFLEKERWKFEKHSSGEIVMTCPVCMKEDHFYFNKDKSLGMCHRCKWACNLIGLIMSFKYSKSATMEMLKGDLDTSISGLKARIKMELERDKEDSFDYYPTYFHNPLPRKAIRISRNKMPVAIKERGFNYSLVEDLGILAYNGSGRFNNRLIIPTTTNKTKTFFGTTALPKKKFKELKKKAERRGEELKKSLFPRGSFMGEVLYRFNELKDSSDPLYVVEGFWDFLRSRKYGFNAMACFGSYVGISQAILLSMTNAEKIYLMLDGDVPIDKVFKKWFFNLQEICMDKEVRLCRLPSKKDPDELSYKEFVKFTKKSTRLLF